ncbi:MAG: 2-C-methyl-D-erythritol 2,4-cyclodiphosphate synthase [Gammaproteobacteria bacterium]
MRVGLGFDAHRFGASRPLVLGGVVIPFQQGLAAHSDGDVLVHALCDALLGAIAGGDIGRHFPDSSAVYRDIDSRILLRSVVERMDAQGYRLGNADIVVIAQAPKLAPYIDSMRSNLAADLNVSPEHISIKATTTEGMGFTGRGEGIAAQAIVLIKRV